MADNEDDYMSDAFLSQMPDVRPGVSMVKRVKEAMRKETLHKEKNIKNRQKSYKEQEQESREAALQSSISSQNKGFTLLQKMGYKAGQGLGKEGSGRVEPVPLNIKTDRGGIGMEELKKRKAKEELQNYRKKVQVKQQMEKKSIEDFRVRKRTEKEERQTLGDLRKSQRACEQLDSQQIDGKPMNRTHFLPKCAVLIERTLVRINFSLDFSDEIFTSRAGVTVPRDSWYWPEVIKDEEAELQEEDECNEDDDEELTPLDKLHFLTSYLRGVHFYCIWCGTAYNDEEDLKSNCPGDTAADHDD